MTKLKPHPGLSYRQQSALARELGIKFTDVPEAMRDWEALDKMGLMGNTKGLTTDAD